MGLTERFKPDNLTDPLKWSYDLVPEIGLKFAAKLVEMFREKVSSKSLKSIGYDPTDLVLEIEFRTGGVYRYLNVPESVYFDLLSAESKGRFFDYSIRDRFVCRKIR